MVKLDDVRLGSVFIYDGYRVIIDRFVTHDEFEVGDWNDYTNGWTYDGGIVHITDLDIIPVNT